MDSKIKLLGKLMKLDEVPKWDKSSFIKAYPEDHPYMMKFGLKAEEVYDHLTKKKSKKLSNESKEID